MSAFVQQLRQRKITQWTLAYVDESVYECFYILRTACIMLPEVEMEF